MLSPQVGNCVDGERPHYRKRWYYDPERETCFAFLYSGCTAGSNRNNFVSYDECRDFCEDIECKSARRLFGEGCWVFCFATVIVISFHVSPSTFALFFSLITSSTHSMRDGVSVL